MNGFWGTPPEPAGPLTEERLLETIEAMKKPPGYHPVIYPASFAKEMKK